MTPHDWQRHGRPLPPGRTPVDECGRCGARSFVRAETGTRFAVFAGRTAGECPDHCEESGVQEVTES